MVTKVTFVGPSFTRKAPKYERFIRPTGLRFTKANVTHPELQVRHLAGSVLVMTCDAFLTVNALRLARRPRFSSRYWVSKRIRSQLFTLRLA